MATKPQLPVVNQQGRAEAAKQRQEEEAARRRQETEAWQKTQGTNKPNAPGYAASIGNFKEVHKVTSPANSGPPSASDPNDIKETSNAPAEMSSTEPPKEIGFDNQLFPNGTESKQQRRKECPVSVMTDSYKSTHLLMYPEALEMRAYGEFRKAFPGMADDRIVVYGIRYYIDNFIKNAIPENDITMARGFLHQHLLFSDKVKDKNYFEANTGDPEKPLNYLDLLKQNKGKFPVKIEAMPEGSVIRPHIPAFIITAEGEYSRLCTFLETLLTMIWYPSCVATLSRHTRSLIEKAFTLSVDEDWSEYQIKLSSRLHDFGFRGCTSVEQSVIGGCAHLLNFAGSDTMSACYYAQHVLNGGTAVGFSIPATEHSVMTSWENEIEAVKNLCKTFPGGMVSAVMDAYDYDRMLKQGLPILRKTVEEHGCTLIVRPDSGDAVEQVMKALEAGRSAGYKSFKNKKGYIVFTHYAVLQGDGIDYTKVKEILEKVIQAGYAASNVAFGMGGGLLQKVNRDTMSFATKLCYMRDKNGKEVSVVKDPAGQKGKLSLGGKMTVLHEHRNNVICGPHFLCTEEKAAVLLEKNADKYARSMKVVYDGRAETDSDDIKAFQKEKFDDVRQRILSEWPLTTIQPVFDSSIDTAQEETRRITRERQKNAFDVAQSDFIPPNLTPNQFATLDAKLQPSSHPADQPTPTLKDSSQLLLDTLDRLL